METPFFLIHENILRENIESFKQGMNQNWSDCKLSYSVKTNSLPWLLKYMNKHNVMAEVVSEEEYELAILCDYQPENIVFNGPIKTKNIFISSVKNHAFVNIDSTRELKWIEEEHLVSERLGIRVNVPPELFSDGDIEYSETGFRFGFSEASGDFQKAVDCLRSTGNFSFGIHLHCNTITRSPDAYKAISKYAVYLIERYDLTPSYIDVGGGFFGGVPGKTTPREYFEIITNEFIKVGLSDILLIAEPGSGIIGSAIDLVTTVMDVKDTSMSRIVTTDGSRIHIDPLWIKSHYMYSLETKNEIKKTHASQMICGYTCMDHDRIMVIENEPELQEGDKIIYHRIGHYSVTFGGMFIRFFPDVYVTDGYKTERVRSRISVRDYYNIEGI